MRARLLARGQPVKVDGRVMVFLMRYKAGPTNQRNIFHCEEYRGMRNSRDLGLVVMSDHYFARHAAPTTVRELRAAQKRVPALLKELAVNPT